MGNTNTENQIPLINQEYEYTTSELLINGVTDATSIRVDLQVYVALEAYTTATAFNNTTGAVLGAPAIITLVGHDINRSTDPLVYDGRRDAYVIVKFNSAFSGNVKIEFRTPTIKVITSPGH